MTKDVEHAFLRCENRPEYERTGEAVRIADLFCGCGGMTLGLAESAHRANRPSDIPLAVDVDQTAVQVYQTNFPKAATYNQPIEELLDGKLGAAATKRELALRRRVGKVSVVLGGPPCQGHSDLNNHSRRNDPRNALYARMARAAEVLSPAAVAVENVQAVTHDKESVVPTTVRALTDAGYSVDQALVDLHQLGVPQSRRRHLLLAIRESLGVDAGQVLAELQALDGSGKDLHWAIRDLLDKEGDSDFDTPSDASDTNRRRMKWFDENPERYELPNELRPSCHRDKEHSYTSVYGRLRWDQPAQTITTGFTSMGQGRYVHPERLRTLTPHEAARIQGFPDWFRFGDHGRTAWSRMIGNAVPPMLTIELGRILIRHQLI